METIITNPLVGKYFKSFSGAKGPIKWKGQIMQEVQPGYFLVEVSYPEHKTVVVRIDGMRGWEFSDKEN